MSACGAWPGRCAPPTQLALPTDIGPPTGRTRLAVLGLSGTAVAVVQWLEGSIDGSTARTRLGACPAAGQIGSEPMRTQPSAASPGEPVGRPAVATGPDSGVARCHRDAAPLPS